MTLNAPFRTRARRNTAGVPYCASRYLTDGRRLFRVVSQLSAGTGRVLCELEDCRTLEVQTYSPGELRAMGVRPVATAG